MLTIGTRIKSLRMGIGLSQTALAKIAGSTQSSINRYENEDSQAPYHILLWYANYFDVSMDYIFCRADNPQGKQYDYQPEKIKAQLTNKADWEGFIQACFEDGTPMNMKLKEMLIKMATEEQK